MSEFSKPNNNETVRIATRAVLRAAGVLAHEPVHDLETALIYLPKAAVRRGDTEFPAGEQMTADEEGEFRAAAAEFGVGAAEDVTSAIAEGDTAVIEGGMINKVLAEIMAAKNAARKVGTMVLTLSANRQLGDADRNMLEVTSKTFDIDLTDLELNTEYDLAQVIARLPGMAPPMQPVEIPVGYSLVDGGAEINSQLGQVEYLGAFDGTHITVLRGDKAENSPEVIEATGNSHYWLNTGQNIPIAKEIANYLEGEDPARGIGAVTSNLYPSRALDLLKADSNAAVSFYGTDTMDMVKGANAPLQPLNQIAAELHSVGSKLQ